MSGQATSLDDLQRRLMSEFSPSEITPSATSQFQLDWMVQQVNAILIYEWLLTQAKRTSFQSSGRSTLPTKWLTALPAVPSPSSDLILLSAGEDGDISQATIET
jgi:hypothetical protein